MKLIIEFDGPIGDLMPVYYLVYKRAAGAVGWASIDEPTFRRLIRRQGRQGPVLPGARPAKVAEMWKHFDQWVEEDSALDALAFQDDVSEAFPKLAREASCTVVTLGRNVEARRRLLERAKLAGHVARTEALSTDPRRRPAELKALCEGDPRAVLVASTDSLVREAGEAELITVGIPTGLCIEPRLHQAGVSAVLPKLLALADELRRGAPELVRAGLRPLSLG